MYKDKYLKYKNKYLELQTGGAYIESCTNKYVLLLERIGILNKKNITIELINYLFELTQCNKTFMENDIPMVQKILKKINQSEKCFQISKKCIDCYIHTYNPDWLDNLLKTQTNYEYLKSIFDVTERTQCCNCVCLVLYLKGDMQSQIDYLNKILEIMIMSLKIIDKYLSDFIVRFYLDSSIFELLYKWSGSLLITKDLNNIELIKKIFLDLKFLIHHSKSEIYIYFCESIILQKDFIEKVRTYRYISLFDDDTNVCCLRDADGIVSIVDCHNIKLFSLQTTHQIALIYELMRSFNPYLIETHPNLILDPIVSVSSINDEIKQLHLRANHYSLWLNLYETLVLSKKEPITLSYIDIIACCICIKVKFTEDYRQAVILNLDSYYNSSDFNSIPNQTIKNKLHIGYDEILLLELFSPMIRVSYKKLESINELNRTEINLKSKLFALIESKPSKVQMINFDTISKYFNINDESEIITYLSKEKLANKINYNSKYIDIVFKNFKLKEEFMKFYFGFGISTLINRNNINNNEFEYIYSL